MGCRALIYAVRDSYNSEGDHMMHIEIIMDSDPDYLVNLREQPATN